MIPKSKYLGLVVEPNNVNINKSLGNLYIKNNQPLMLLLENIKILNNKIFYIL